MNVTIIGVAGGTGSGKSTLVKRLREAFEGDDVVTLCHDFYYKAHNELTYEERTKLNYDHPDAFETELLVEHLAALREGKAVEVPVYDFPTYDRTDATTTVYPSRVIIVEGIVIFASPELREQMDLKVFVDVDADVRILRRLVRDVRERGRSVESVVNQYLETVKPMHEQFVEPFKYSADILVPGGGRNPAVIDLLVSRIKAHLT